jgi:hypothetical protein
MEVVFGVQARDGSIRVQLSEDEVAELKKRLEDTFKGDSSEIFWVIDKDGREIGIPTDKIAYVEFGADKASRQVGFSSES